MSGTNAERDPRFGHMLQRPSTHLWASLRRDLVEHKNGIRPGMSVAHVGCGDGSFTGLLAGEVGPTGTVVAVSYQDYWTNRVRAQLSRSVCTTHVYTSAAQVVTQSCDVVFVYGYLQNVQGRAALMAQITRMLKVGGRVYLVHWIDDMLDLGLDDEDHARMIEQLTVNESTRCVRTLPSDLHKMGFGNVGYRVRAFTTNTYYGPQFIGMVRSGYNEVQWLVAMKGVGGIKSEYFANQRFGSAALQVVTGVKQPHTLAQLIALHHDAALADVDVRELDGADQSVPARSQEAAIA